MEQEQGNKTRVISRTAGLAASVVIGIGLGGVESSQSGEDSSPVDSLSPIGTVRSADLAPVDAQPEVDEIESKAGKEETEKSSTIQSPQQPMTSGQPSQPSPIRVHLRSVPKPTESTATPHRPLP